jgi:hypothetical protein
MAKPLKPEDVKVTNLGRAKIGSRMYKRGWTVNMTDQKPTPAPAPKKPGK